MNFEVKHCTPIANATAFKQEPATKTEVDTEQEPSRKSEISNLRDAITQLQRTSSAREEVLNTNFSYLFMPLW